MRVGFVGFVGFVGAFYTSACGTAGDANKPTPRSAKGGESQLILYADGARLSYRRSVEFDARGVAVVADAVVGKRTEARLVGGAALDVDRQRLRDRASLVVRGGSLGARDVEISTWLDGLNWKVAYTLILEGGESRLAKVQGSVSIESKLSQPLRADTLTLVAGPSAADMRADEFAADAASPSQARQTKLSSGFAIAAGGRARVPLIDGSKQRRVSRLAVFEPLGSSLSHQGAKPIVRRDYGLASQRQWMPVEMSIAIELSEQQRARMPAGQVSLFRRQGKDVVALGAVGDGGRGDDDAKDAEDKQHPTAWASRGLGEVRIGSAPGLRGRRWQEELDVDKISKRLVEEIRIEVANESDEKASVVLDEHLYRGLNWSLAYHNGVGTPTKRGPQKIRFSLTVPATESVLVVYRVVYTW